MSKKNKVKSTELKPFEDVIEKDAKYIAKYLEENRKAIKETYSIEEMNGLYCRVLDYFYDKEEAPFKIDFDNEISKRQSWHANHTLIMGIVHKYIKEYGTLPAISHIAEEAKLSRVTVTKHLKYFERNEFLKLNQNKWKLATENMMKQIYTTAFTDYDASTRLKASALYLKYASKVLYPESNSSNEKTHQTNNFIQINNIYINQETIAALPDDKRQTIEALIIEANEGVK